MYANRGMALEQMIELSNNIYRRDMVADIRKVPTAIRPVRTDRKGMVYGFWEQKSTVDFTGIANFGVKPIPIAFDAKETKGKSLPLANIAGHQLEYMERFGFLGGKAFLVVHFTELDRYFRLRAMDLMGYIGKPWPGNQKSLPLKFFESYAYEIVKGSSDPLDYLDGIDG